MEIFTIIFFIALVALLVQIPVWIWAVLLLILTIGAILN